MPRGRTLANVRQDVKKELLDSANVNLGKNANPSINAKLQRVQRTLYRENEWTFLTKNFDKTLSAGQYLYDIPTGLAYDTIIEIRHKWGGSWSPPLDQGIDMDHYNEHDTDNDDRSDPVMRWDFTDTSGTTQIEVHPIPATNQTNALRFRGKTALLAFDNDTDVCTFDSDLLALYVAAEILDARGRKEAAQVFGKAEHLLKTLKGKTKGKKVLNLNARRVSRRPLTRIHISAG